MIGDEDDDDDNEDNNEEEVEEKEEEGLVHAEEGEEKCTEILSKY